MWGNKNLPEFGQLSGVKVVHATEGICGPLVAAFLADMGADIVWLEPVDPDICRFDYSYFAEAERRNQRDLAVGIPTLEGREILARLLKDADLFVESGPGDRYRQWGLSDEVLWEINPRLVIAHISPYGQTGLSEYVSRPCSGDIAQAYTGYMWLNENPVTPPFAVGPWIGDYVTALDCSIAAIAALTKVRETGIGESIDCSMSECVLRQEQRTVDYLTVRKKVWQTGYPTPNSGVGPYKCRDGEYIQLNIAGSAGIRRAVEFFGMEYGGEVFPPGLGIITQGQPGFDMMEDAIHAYLATKTADEVQDELTAIGCAVQKISSLADVERNPHIRARGTIQELESVKGVKVRYVGHMPVFKRNPGRTWRSAPYQGMDNEEILGELGYSEEEIATLYAKGVIAKDVDMKFVYPYEKPGVA